MEQLKYADIETYLREAVQLIINMERTGMDWKEEFLSKLPVQMKKQIANKYREDDDVKWREKLITIGKDQERVRKGEKYQNLRFLAVNSRGKKSQRRHKQFQE